MLQKLKRRTHAHINLHTKISNDRRPLLCEFSLNLQGGIPESDQQSKPHSHESLDTKDIERLKEELAKKGFVPLEQKQEAEFECGFEIDMPREQFTEVALVNLKRIVEAKGGLIASAVRTGDVKIIVTEDYVYPRGDEVYNVDMVYVCDDFEGELNAQADEVSELRWFRFDDVPENLSPPVSGIIRDFIRQKLNSSTK